MSYNKEKILLVDDESSVLDFLSYNLKKEGYEVRVASNGVKALEKTKIFKPDLIIVDIMMPEMDGIELCGLLREDPLNDMIIVFLTARNEDYTQIVALESGGDDYIAKPIKPKVLVAKIKSLLKRKHKKKNIIKYNNVMIDLEKHEVKIDEKKINLPKKEFQILKILLKDPGKVFSREKIFKLVWGDNVFVGGRTIDVHVKKIRTKFGQNFISTIKGIGYKINDD